MLIWYENPALAPKKENGYRVEKIREVDLNKESLAVGDNTLGRIRKAWPFLVQIIIFIWRFTPFVLGLSSRFQLPRLNLSNANLNGKQYIDKYFFLTHSFWRGLLKCCNNFFAHFFNNSSTDMYKTTSWQYTWTPKLIVC